MAHSRHLEAEDIYRGTLDMSTLTVYAPFSPLDTSKGQEGGPLASCIRDMDQPAPLAMGSRGLRLLYPPKRSIRYIVQICQVLLPLSRVT